jgi:hypothetical protein
VLSFFSSRRNWDSPPLSRKRVCPPTLWPGEEGTLARGRGVGGSPNSDEGTYSVVLYSIYKYFVTKESSVSGKNVCVLCNNRGVQRCFGTILYCRARLFGSKLEVFMKFFPLGNRQVPHLPSLFRRNGSISLLTLT